MKISIFVTLFVVLLFSGLHKRPHTFRARVYRAVQDAKLYKVYKIDSIHSYYLIYAKRKDTLYKIISEKVSSGDCKSIKINHEYEFELESLLGHNRKLPNIKLTLEASMRVNGLYYDDSTMVRLERDSINDLHSVVNVRGLCLFKKVNMIKDR